MEVLILHRPST